MVAVLTKEYDYEKYRPRMDYGRKRCNMVSAYNSVGESFRSSYVSATTPSIDVTLIDSRDGKVYKSVKMPDGRVWMAGTEKIAETRCVASKIEFGGVPSNRTHKCGVAVLFSYRSPPFHRLPKKL